MAYQKREYIPDHFYHITTRGNRRDPLFFSSTDFFAFLHILKHVHQDIPFEIASYCLMTNHYHLQLRSKEAHISAVMSRINKRYANYYNTRHNLSGHVYEKRFFDKIIRDEVGMKAVSKYIHLNPVRANIVKKPEDYPWSSFYLFQFPKKKLPSFMNINHILDLYSGTIEEKSKKYCEENKQEDAVKKS